MKLLILMNFRNLWLFFSYYRAISCFHIYFVKEIIQLILKYHIVRPCWFWGLHSNNGISIIWKLENLWGKYNYFLFDKVWYTKYHDPAVMQIAKEVLLATCDQWINIKFVTLWVCVSSSQWLDNILHFATHSFSYAQWNLH